MGLIWFIIYHKYMCGIIAGISTEIIELLLQGLIQLQNRGYDSAGITTINNTEFITTKYASEKESALKKNKFRKNKTWKKQNRFGTYALGNTWSENRYK